MLAGVLVAVTCWAAVAQENGGPEKVKSAWERPAGWGEIVADPAKLDKYRCPKPAEFGLVFSWGYGGDHMPVEDARFEQVLKKAKECGYNVMHCTYTPSRLELCRKYGLKMKTPLPRAHSRIPVAKSNFLSVNRNERVEVTI